MVLLNLVTYSDQIHSLARTRSRNPRGSTQTFGGSQYDVERKGLIGEFALAELFGLDTTPVESGEPDQGWDFEIYGKKADAKYRGYLGQTFDLPAHQVPPRADLLFVFTRAGDSTDDLLVRFAGFVTAGRFCAKANPVDLKYGRGWAYPTCLLQPLKALKGEV